MPELPEVEAVRKGLEQLLIGQTIKRVRVFWPRIVGSETLEEAMTFISSLQGQTIQGVSRRGKYIIIDLDNYFLISHLRMEGKYHFYSKDDTRPDIPSPHVHVAFEMEDGSRLDYHDVRKFGRMEILAKDNLTDYFEEKGLGPEPHSDTFELLEFQQGLTTTNRAIKPALLDQGLVAGLGNIYVDEVLYRAGIHPSRPASSLNEKEAYDLHQAILIIMQDAIEAGGSSVRTYKNALGQAGTYQNQLQVYGRQGQSCPRCGHDLVKIQLGQRGTHFCPHCQQLPED